MADEFRHADVVIGRITENEYESISEHIFNSQATGDMMIATSPTQLSRLTITNDRILVSSGGLFSWSDTLPAFTAGGDIIGQATYDLGSAASPFAEAYIGNATDYLRIAIVGNIPTIYGVGAYVRIGDADAAPLFAAIEDDLYVTRYLEVKGLLYTHANITVGNDIIFATDAGVIRPPSADDNYTALQARNNGVANVDIARLQGAAEPRFRHIAPINYGPEQDHTIAAGVITIDNNSGYISVIVQGGAGSGNDDLDTINGGAEGDLIVLKSNTSGGADTVTVTEAGNIILNAAGNFAMNHVDDRIMLIYNGASWCEISRSDNS